MNSMFHLWRLWMLVFVGVSQRDYQQPLDYVLAENRLLRKKLGKKWISLTDDERRVLALKGKLLGRRILQEGANLVTPDTILRWHRELDCRQAGP